MYSALVISTASSMPPQSSAAGTSSPLSGPTNSRPSPLRSTTARRCDPTPGSTTAMCTPTGRNAIEAGQHPRALRHRLRIDAVGEVDHLGIGAGADDHAVADADERIGRAEVGQERDHRAHRAHCTAARKHGLHQSVDVMRIGLDQRLDAVLAQRAAGHRADRDRPQRAESRPSSAPSTLVDGGGRGERDQVGGHHGVGVDRLAPGAVEVQHVDLGPPLPQAVGQHRASTLGSSDQHPPAGARRRAPRPATPGRPARRRTSATMPRAAMAAAVARPTAATVHAVQHPHVAVEQPLDAVGAGQADDVVRAQVGRLERQRLDRDRRRLDHVRAQLRRAGRPARLPAAAPASPPPGGRTAAAARTSAAARAATPPRRPA